MLFFHPYSHRNLFVVGCMVLLTGTPLFSTETIAPDDLEFFEKRIRPALISHCYECHSEKENKRKGGLWLDRKSGWETGGDSGTAIVPDDPEESLFVHVVNYADPDIEMPPDGKLPANVIADFKEWIRRGAPDPREGVLPDNSNKKGAEIDIGKGREFWSFQTIRKPQIPSPENSDWQRNEIDRFVHSKLEQAGLSPAPDVSIEARLRRAKVDLTGLLPTIAEQDEFLASPSAKKWEELIDRWLASDAFGEKWGRHWLDIVRYADTSGGGRAMPFPDAWRFRDYVLDSFRADRPLDELIQSHLAGDLLPYDSEKERADNLIASGFLVLGPHNYENQNKDELNLEIADEQMETMGRAFMGMTIGCARCHDHKFDPIPTSDYYAMAGIFLSTNSVSHANVSKWHTELIPGSEKVRSNFDDYKKKEAAAKKRVTSLRRSLAAMGQSVDGGKPGGADPKQLLAEFSAAEKDLKRIKKAAPKIPSSMCVIDKGKEDISGTEIRIRGVEGNKGEIMKRGFLRVASWEDDEIPQTSSGRLELSRWLTDPRHPLTARVLANRIWLHLMGQGIVKSVDNFGTTGEKPTHPELLDYLASSLIESGWSTKSLVKKIMMSRVYSMDSEGTDPKGFEIDPENLLLWHAHRRMLDAEAMRDAMLTLGGVLDSQRGGPSLPTGFKSEFGFEITTLRRSVYVPVFRNSGFEMFSLFGFANPNFTVGKRSDSTIPTQSLFLANAPLLHSHADSAASALLQDPILDDAARVEMVFRKTLGRHPTENESKMALAFLRSSGDTAKSNNIAAWAALQRSLFACLDFRFLR